MNKPVYIIWLFLSIAAMLSCSQRKISGFVAQCEEMVSITGQKDKIRALMVSHISTDFVASRWDSAIQPWYRVTGKVFAIFNASQKPLREFTPCE